MDSDVEECRDSGAGKGSKKHDGFRKTFSPPQPINGSVRIFSEMRPILITGPQMAARRFNFKTIYSTLAEEPKTNRGGVDGRNRLIQYHPFFDFDYGKELPRDLMMWERDVTIITDELTRVFGLAPTMYTREPCGGVHYSYPGLRISSDHLFKLYQKISTRISMLLRVLSLDITIINFPMPMRVKDGTSYYRDARGSCEPHPVARGTEPYAHTSLDGPVPLTSASVWLSPELLAAVFDPGNVIHKLAAKLVEATGGFFFVSQILQQLIFYQESYQSNVLHWLAFDYPDSYPARMAAVCDLLGWDKPHEMHSPRQRRPVDIFVSMAIRMFRTPDPGLGSETSIDSITKLEFSINGYYMAQIQHMMEQRHRAESLEEFNADRIMSRARPCDVAENIVVFYNDARGRVKLFTGSDWAIVNRDAIGRLLSSIGISERKIQSVANRISGKYCQLYSEKPEPHAVYLANGGYYMSGRVTQYIDPLDAPATARVGITFEDLMYAKQEGTREMVEHVMSDESLSGVCDCPYCSVPSPQVELALGAARYIYLLMCCRGPLTRWVIQFFAKICFKLERKQIIVLLGETAGNGKTEFVHVLHTVFGSYLRSLAQSTSTNSRKEMAADVKFAEFATLCAIDDALADYESEESTMNVTTLKSLTGGGLNFSRGLYDTEDGQREFHMNLLFTGNTHMTVPPDRGVFNRLKNIPFKMRFLDCKGLDANEYNQYVAESWRVKVQRVQRDFADPRNCGTAFDAGLKMKRDLLGRGLAIIFSTLATFRELLSEPQPVEVDQVYKQPTKRSASVWSSVPAKRKHVEK